MPQSRYQRLQRLLVVVLMPMLIMAAQGQKPLTNADVIEMVTSGLPEATIVRSMQTTPANFDVSPNALIALHQAGVSQKIMDAMLTAASRRPPRAPGAATPRARGGGALTPSATSTLSGPSATLVQGDSRQPLALERSKLTQTTAHAQSLAGLAKDRMLDQALRTGMSTVKSQAGRAGRAVVSQGGGVFGGVIAGATKPKTKKLTYVWALEGLESQNVTSTDAIGFDVSVGSTVGIRAADYTPVVVKLTPTPNGWRLIGATEGVAGATSRSAVDWPVYSSFIEDRVPVQTTALSEGTWRVVVAGPLASGEYGVVLRPVAKHKQFKGQDVARNQGDGELFNAVWSFSVR